MSSTSKSRIRLRPRVSALVVFLVLAAGSADAWGGQVMSDFSLIDVNEASSMYGQAVSPRDYLQRTSGWYFGHAT